MSTNTTTTRKTACPITREQFAQHAKVVNCTVGTTPVPAMARVFSTNSMGFYASAKAMVEIDGVQVPCQVAITITAIGSKELPLTTPAKTEAA